MKTVYNESQNGHEYTLISESNFLSDCNNVNWISYHTYIRDMFMKKPIFKELWDCVKPDQKYHEIRSDIIRFFYLSENEDVLYADTDVIIHELPDFQYDKIYFSQKGRWTIDIFIMYNGKHRNIFASMLEISATRSMELYRKLNMEIRRGWVFNIINRVNLKNRKTISQTIPAKCFTHYWCHARN